MGHNIVHVIILWLTYYRLDQELDFETPSISLHLGQIADSMYEWEGPVAEQLGLTSAEIAAIKMEHPGKLELQT